ncbi:MAG: hypothetical protein WC934_08430 [Acidithiobacillus sp.]|jgi:hypothetical protein|uniref:hypothetical protein n=1 Tax=Acidithiobacillus sp. TaxID=1872118 RepID=UPI00355EE3E6
MSSNKTKKIYSEKSFNIFCKKYDKIEESLYARYEELLETYLAIMKNKKSDVRNDLISALMILLEFKMTKINHMTGTIDDLNKKQIELYDELEELKLEIDEILEDDCDSDSDEDDCEIKNDQNIGDNDENSNLI